MTSDVTRASWHLDREVQRVTSGQPLLATNQDSKLLGRKSDDTIIGGDGSDILDGRAGSDVLTGGPGADFFVISSGVDRITDFNPSEGDQIVFQSTGDVLRTTEDGNTVIRSLDGTIETTIENISHEIASLFAQQRLKTTYDVEFSNGASFKLESADSSFNQSLGMMQRERLRPRRGMMFPQPKKSNGSVYMFNCIEPLDLIFLRNGKIVDMNQNTPICTDLDPAACPVYESQKPFDNWLEFRAGTIDKVGLDIGDTAVISPL